jgi:hypothetical protein
VSVHKVIEFKIYLFSNFSNFFVLSNTKAFTATNKIKNSLKIINFIKIVSLWMDTNYLTEQGATDEELLLFEQ